MQYHWLLGSLKIHWATILCGGLTGLLVAVILNVAEHPHWESPSYPSPGTYLTVAGTGFFLASIITFLLVRHASDDLSQPKGILSWSLRGVAFGLGFPLIYGGILPFISLVIAVKSSVFTQEEIFNIALNALFQVPGSMIVNMFLGVPTALWSVPLFASAGWLLNHLSYATDKRMRLLFPIVVAGLFAVTTGALLLFAEASTLAAVGWN